MSARAALALIVAGILAGSPVAGQGRTRIVAQADSAFASGDIRLADSLYYIAVRVRPRDPEARAALGRYLGAQGKAKVAVVLLEEARMFGGDPAQVARQLVPLYEELGDWRALLTLPGSPLTGSQRRRAAWLAENPFAIAMEGGAASIVGAPKGDTIARVAVRVNGKAALGAIVSGDVGFAVSSRLSQGARHFGDDSSVVVFDSIAVGQAKFVNVPAIAGSSVGSVAIGVTALGRMVVQIDYARNRIVMSRADAGPVEARYVLARFDGELRVLDRGHWISLAELAAGVAKSSKTLIVDYPAGEARVRK